MSNSRTSNKQILDAIERLTDVLTKQATAPEPVVPTLVPEPTANSGETKINVDKSYLSHMDHKASDFAVAKQEDTILYARLNGKGETKLAYCVASRWANLKDRGLIGPIKHIQYQAS